MRKQVEILVYQYKKRNNLDVYSHLTRTQKEDLLLQIQQCIDIIGFKTLLIEEERIQP